jgi:catechol 2,3-dioxygenase-like lactoylglutathione lyase family enzyme
MSVQLDHAIAPARDKVAAAKRLGELLGVPWAASGAGPFSPVYVSDSFTLDFVQTDQPVEIYHFCFRVSEAEFDAIHGRLVAQGIPYRSNVHGPVDMKINTDYGGRILYWNVPEGHQWEILTISYARQPK